MEKKFLSGNEAAARGAWEAGVHVATAYPGTPSTEILENVTKYKEIYAQWSPNEKTAFEVALGASIAGARTMVSMKHVGLNVAADPFFSASYTGVNGGFVIISADDPGMHSSQNEQDNRRYAKFAKIPVIEPSDSQEVKDYIKEAFDISEKFDTPVLFRLTTRISHSKGIVKVDKRNEIPLKEYKKLPEKYIILPAHAKKRHYFVEERILKLKEFANKTHLNRIEWGDRKLGIITSGISYVHAREVFPDASYLKLGLSWPFPEELLKEFLDGVEKVIIIEENEPFLEEEIKFLGYNIDGKKFIPFVDELSPDVVREGVLGKEIERLPDGKGVKRPPQLCPGCPHIGIFYNLWRLRATVTGDIGCYTLGALPPYNAMDTTICMGASVTNAHGFSVARGWDLSKKTVAVIGDSTFVHSGITGLIDVVYNKGNSTVVILDNRITAMTGHQFHPGSGKTAKGEETKVLDFEKLSKAVGVEKVYHIDPHKLRESRKALREAMASKEPVVVLSERPCALLPEERKKARTRPKKVVLPDKCKGEKCMGCIKLGCPALSMRDGKAYIEPLLCVGCDLCQQVCPFDAIVEEGENG